MCTCGLAGASFCSVIGRKRQASSTLEHVLRATVVEAVSVEALSVEAVSVISVGAMWSSQV